MSTLPASVQILLSPTGMICKPFNIDEARLLKGKLRPAIYHPASKGLLVMPPKQGITDAEQVPNRPDRQLP